MTIDQVFLLILVLLFAIAAILAVFSIWFYVWKYISDHSGNIVEWDDDDTGDCSTPEADAEKK